MQIPSDENLVSGRFHGGEFQVDGARLFRRARQAGRLRIRLRAIERNAHRFPRILNRGLSQKRSCESQQQGWAKLHKFMLPDRVE